MNSDIDIHGAQKIYPDLILSFPLVPPPAQRFHLPSEYLKIYFIIATNICEDLRFPGEVC